MRDFATNGLNGSDLDAVRIPRTIGTSVWEDAWITLVENDESCLRTLVFGKSLHRTRTNRKTIVLAGPLVSSKTRKLLEKEFDGFAWINQNLLEIEGLTLKNCAILHCWSLSFVKKCTFVDPSLLMIQNCDDLFEEDKTNPMDNGGVKIIDCPEASILTLSPSLDTYDYLLRKLQPKKSGSQVLEDPNFLFRNFIMCKNVIQTDRRRFMVSVDLEKDSSSAGSSDPMSLVKFVGKHPLELELKEGSAVVPSNAGRFEKEILKYWNSLLEEANQEGLEGTEVLGGARPVNEPIAIIGISGRFPGANNVDEFWSLLENGRGGQVPVPDDRWTAEQSCVIKAEDRKIEAGFLKCPVDEFDGKFFQMSPMELVNTDPQQRFLLEVSWEALEDAVIDPSSLKGTQTGIFTGIWTHDYSDLMIESGFRGTEFYRSYMGNSYGATGGRLAHFLDVNGPNIATESGCSSSMVAVGLACKSLRNGESSLALACGVNLLLKPFFFEDFKVVTSPDSRCKVFDSKADGYGRAEGCGVLVLKRLSDAVRDGDRVRAVIRGYGQTQEGISLSMGTPTLECESLAMKLALSDANVEPHEVSFVEAHGTGTPVGDPLEMAAIQSVYSKGRVEPLLVGSVKSNVGHTESCSGITGIIKTILALENETIPPNINFETLNPKINLEKIPAEIPLTPKPWKRIEGHRRIAGVSSFGITGTDAHLILEESPLVHRIHKTSTSQFPSRVLSISAKTEDALNDLIEGYKNHLQLNPMDLADVAFTANTGRSHFSFRTTVMGQNCGEILKKIEEGSFTIKQFQGERPKLCFLFTGQGSQYRGMGKTLYEACPIFRDNFDACDDILQNSYGLSIRPVLWTEEDSGELHRTIYSQISIFVIEYCLLKVWGSWGVKPDMVLGHSLGEFTAATAAGMLSFEDAIKLVANRSRLIESLPQGKMLVIRADKKATEVLLKELEHHEYWLDIAAVNTPDQTVVSGSEKSIQRLAEIAESKGIKTHILDATQAFHSRAMDPILGEYGTVASEVTYSSPTCTYISGMEGKRMEAGVDADYWVRHTRLGVEFQEACEEVKNAGSHIFLEIGPQPVLLALLARNWEDLPPAICQFSIKKNQNEWTTMLTTLANVYMEGVAINWHGFHRYCRGNKVLLPFYQFQRSKYWFPPTEYKHKRSSSVHPLLGFPLPINASYQSVFHNYLDVNQKATFLNDHLIGNIIVMPGAGYTEICLAAAETLFLSNLGGEEILPTFPLMIENLQFKSPLTIPNNKKCEMQTVISNIDSTDDSSEMKKIAIYKLQKDNNWVCHAEGTFRLQYLEPQQQFSTNFEEIKNKFKEEVDAEEFYKKVANLGLNLGPTFQCMKKMWKNGTEIFTQLTIPTDFNEYLIHPCVIDTMLQSLMIETSTLQLPVGIENFHFYGKSLNRVNYLHSTGETGSGRLGATLYDEDGKTLAILIGAEMMPTSLEFVNRVLDAQELNLPQIFDEVWKPCQDGLVSPLQDQILSRTSNVWIVLSDEETFSQDLLEKIKGGGGQVFNIGCGHKFERISSTELLVRPDDKVDMEMALTTILADDPQRQLEGIVYMWGMKDGREPMVMALGLIHLIQSLLNTKLTNFPGIFVATHGAVYIGDQMAAGPAAGTLWGLCRSFRSEHQTVRCRCVDVELDEPISSRNQHLLSELWNRDAEYEVAYRNGIRYVPRLTSANLTLKPLPIPKSGRYAIIHSPTQSIDGLKFGHRPKGSIGSKGIEIQIKAAGLNFKELLNVLKPTEEFQNSNSIGMDFSGIVSEIGAEVTSLKVGDAVMGYNVHNGGLPSHIIATEDTVVPLPNDMNFAEAAGLSVAFATVYQSFITYGKLGRNETVLIHSASGAVGIVAIQVAHYLGAEVIATAGSKRKRAFLRSSYGIQHVFDSRSLSFGDRIKQVTSGKGVSLVLNSLTGPGFKETSLSTLGPGGRFVEMGKLNIWTEYEVATLRPDVKYTVVDLAADSEDYDTFSKLHRRLGEFLSLGAIRPIPFVQYEAAEIRQALSYLQKAQHVGKVVVVMPDVRTIKGNVVLKSNLFNDRSTYLITGGLGGIGLEVAKWMVNLGAKYIVLCGRNKPNDKVQRVIDDLIESGMEIKVITANIGNLKECDNLLKTIKEPALGLPPLRGIMHAAGCLSDQLLVNQTKERFDVTFNAKVNGGWNLHQLTCTNNLEHFVMFSSISSVLGAMGQCNYAAANSYLDCLVHYRQALGLPATSINWGQWGHVGMAVDMNIPGLEPFTPSQGLSALELILKVGKLHSTVVLGDTNVWKLIYPWTKKYLEQMKSTTQSRNDRKTVNQDMSTEKFWKDLEGAADHDLKYHVIEKSVSFLISSIMKMESQGGLDLDQNFEELGWDSLMRIELKNMLQGLLGSAISLSLSDISDCNTIRLLSKRVFELIYGNKDKTVLRNARKQLIRDDCILPSHIKGDGIYMKPSEINVVLVTGVTGNLGPYILETLSNQSQLSKIYCIVRAKTAAAAKDRLINCLMDKTLPYKTIMQKVVVITGNVSDANLGMSQKMYDSLVTEVDAVINIAVKSSYIEEYRKSDGNLTDTRTVNVIGIHRVLEFASASKTKWVFHASTLLGARKGGENGTIPETWPQIDEFDDMPNFGYATSKYISDRLMAQAVEVGIPCKVFRFVIITGDSIAGRQAVKDNHFFVKYMCYLQSGMVPSMPIPLQIMPVDVSAKISLQIFFEDAAPAGVYNVTNPHNNSEQDLPILGTELGYPMKIVEYPEFVKKIVDDGEKSLLHTMTEFYTDDERYLRYMEDMELLKWYAKNPSEFYVSKKLMKFIPNLLEIVDPPLVILKRDLKYARETGAF